MGKMLKSSTDFKDVSVGVHPAICFAIFDIGTQENVFEGKTHRRQQIVFQFEVQDEMTEEGEPLIATAFVTANLSPKSTLRKWLVSYRGRDLTEEEEENGVDIERFLGRTCHIVVEPKESGKGTKVTNLLPQKKGQSTKSFNGLKSFFMEEGEPITDKTIKGLPEWILKKVSVSPEFKALRDVTAKPVFDSTVEDADEEVEVF